MLDAQTFADTLRNPDDPLWQDAYDKLVAIVRGYLRGGRRWPRVQESATAVDQDLAGELAHEFWLRLKENPNILSAAVVRGYGAVGWEIVRFLRTPTLTSVEVSESRLKEHLSSKLRVVLRRGEYQELKRNFWGRSGVSERAATNDDIERVRRDQPLLTANWTPQRSNQDPPIVGIEALGAHANAVIKLADAYIWIGDLCDLSWRALTPALAGSGPHVRAAIDVAAVSVGDEYRDFELPILLHRYFDTLDADAREFARLAYGECGASVREIEARTGSGKSTVNRKLKAFQAGLAEYLKASGYGGRDMDVVATALRDILAS